MKLVTPALVVSVALIACKGGDRPAPPTSGSGSGSASVDLCALGKAALSSLTMCNGKPIEQELLKAKQTFIGVVDMITKTSPGADSQTTCAQMLHALDGSLAPLGCPIPLAPATRARMLDLVDAWYAVRTEVKPTGNAAADAVIERVVKVRDAACACTTELCLEGVQKQLETLGAFGSDAPEAATKLGEKLLDDVGRCGARIGKPVKR